MLERRKYSFIKLELISLKIKFAAGLSKSASAALGALLHTLHEIPLCRRDYTESSPGFCCILLIFISSVHR